MAGWKVRAVIVVMTYYADTDTDTVGGIFLDRGLYIIADLNKTSKNSILPIEYLLSGSVNFTELIGLTNRYILNDCSSLQLHT